MAVTGFWFSLVIMTVFGTSLCNSFTLLSNAIPKLSKANVTANASMMLGEAVKVSRVVKVDAVTMDDAVKVDDAVKAIDTQGEWVNCPFCGLNKRNRIVGGRAASIKDFPWTVDIRIGANQHCGGSIIRNRYVLTAAHCVVGHNTTKFIVVASVTDILDTKAVKRKVESSAYHPQFDPSTYDYDIAVIKLTKALPVGKGVRTACLPTAAMNTTHVPINEYAIVSGWGSLSEKSATVPNQLQKLGVPIVSNEQCQAARGLKGQLITDRMLCAGYLDGKKDACSGDSGGPLVWYNKGIWTQIGIVSWGIGCARANYYGIYTRVSALTSWIAQNTDGPSQC